MFSPHLPTPAQPVPSILQPGSPQTQRRLSSQYPAPGINNGTRPSREQRDPRDTQRDRRRDRESVQNLVVPLEEDMRKLFEECEMARGNAQLLMNSLTYAKPEDLYGDGGTVIQVGSTFGRCQVRGR